MNGGGMEEIKNYSEARHHGSRGAKYIPGEFFLELYRFTQQGG